MFKLKVRNQIDSIALPPSTQARNGLLGPRFLHPSPRICRKTFEPHARNKKFQAIRASFVGLNDILSIMRLRGRNVRLTAAEQPLPPISSLYKCQMFYSTAESLVVTLSSSNQHDFGNIIQQQVPLIHQTNMISVI